MFMKKWAFDSESPQTSPKKGRNRCPS